MFIIPGTENQVSTVDIFTVVIEIYVHHKVSNQHNTSEIPAVRGPPLNDGLCPQNIPRVRVHLLRGRPSLTLLCTLPLELPLLPSQTPTSLRLTWYLLVYLCMQVRTEIVYQKINTKTN